MLRLALCAMLVAAAYARTNCYNPQDYLVDGEEICDHGRYCDPEADVCENGRCKCTTEWGQEEMLCADPDSDDFGVILSDPQAWTVNKRQQGSLPVPCMYEFSRFKSNIVSTDSGTCDVRIMVYNKRVHGKMYVGGFEVYIYATNLATKNNDQDMVYKADGWSDGDNYCFHYVASNDGGSSYGENVGASRFKIDSAPYTYTVDEGTNRLNLQISQCGLHLEFRPANESLGVFDQKWMPGFAFKVDLDTAPEYLNEDTVVSLPPGLRISDSRVNTDVMSYLAFTGEGNSYDNYDYYSDQCPAAKTALEQCSDEATLDNAMAQCRFALHRPHFVKCYSDSGSSPDEYGMVDRILALYIACVDSFCESTSSVRESRCNDMKASLDELDDDCYAQLPPMSGYACTISART